MKPINFSCFLNHIDILGNEFADKESIKTIIKSIFIDLFYKPMIDNYIIKT